MLQTRVAAAAAQARARDADHRRDRRARRARADRSRLDGVLPARRAAVARRTRCSSSSVVTNPRVPRVVRHSLNLESGLNDGLALPAVLAFTAALASATTTSSGGSSCSRTSTLGLRLRARVGFVAAGCCRAARARRRDPRPPEVAVRARDGVRDLRPRGRLPPQGNGLIAVFVCAIMLGIRRPDVRATFEHRAEDIVEIVKLGMFVVFGSLLTLDGLFGDGWAAVGDRRRDAARRAPGGDLDRAARARGCRAT